MKIHMAKKWPETVFKQLFKSNIHFRSVFIMVVFSKAKTSNKKESMTQEVLSDIKGVPD